MLVHFRIKVGKGRRLVVCLQNRQCFYGRGLRKWCVWVCMFCFSGIDIFWCQWVWKRVAGTHSWKRLIGLNRGKCLKARALASCLFSWPEMLPWGTLNMTWGNESSAWILSLPFATWVNLRQLSVPLWFCFTFYKTRNQNIFFPELGWLDNMHKISIKSYNLLAGIPWLPGKTENQYFFVRIPIRWYFAFLFNGEMNVCIRTHTFILLLFPYIFIDKYLKGIIIDRFCLFFCFLLSQRFSCYATSFLRTKTLFHSTLLSLAHHSSQYIWVELNHL